MFRRFGLSGFETHVTGLTRNYTAENNIFIKKKFYRNKEIVYTYMFRCSNKD